MKRLIFLILFGLMISSVSASFSYSSEGLNEWTAPYFVEGTATVVVDGYELYGLPVVNEIKFTPEAGKTYFLQRRLVSLVTLLGSCWWYDTVWVMKEETMKKVADGVFSFHGDCYGKPRYSSQWASIKGNWQWFESKENSFPETELSADVYTGILPLKVVLRGGCSDAENRLEYCWIDFDDGSEKEFETGIQHVFTEAGEFVVVLNAKDLDGKISQKKIIIEVLSNKESSINFVSVDGLSKGKELIVKANCTIPTVLDLVVYSPKNEIIYDGEMNCSGEKKTIELKTMGNHKLIASIHGNCKTNCLIKNEFFVSTGIFDFEENQNTTASIAILLFIIFTFFIFEGKEAVSETLQKNNKK